MQPSLDSTFARRSVNGSIRILLVEDDPVTAMIEVEQLEQYKYQVHRVSTGEEAVAICNPEHFDLVLMDIDLGDGIDGTEAAQRILDSWDMPLIFLSSHTEKEVVELTEKITSYGYVVKNSGITILDASIKMAMKLFRAKEAQMKAQYLAEESESKYSYLFDNMWEEVHLWKVIRNEEEKIINWRLVDVNKAALKSWGRSKEEVVDKLATEIWTHMDPISQFLPLVESIFSTGQPETWQEHFEGTGQTLLMTSVAFKDYFISTGRDISEICDIQHFLKQELKYRETLLSEVHHRVKNSIANIEQLLQLKLEEDARPEVQDALREAITLVATNRELYDRLLLEEHFERVDMHEYLSALLDLLQRTYASTNRVKAIGEVARLSLKPELAMKVGIITNELLTNAFKYAFPNGGKGVVKVILEESEGMVVLAISDDGVGADGDLLSLANEGFGLKLVRSLVQRMDGKLAIRQSNGVTVEVRLPYQA